MDWNIFVGIEPSKIKMNRTSVRLKFRPSLKEGRVGTLRYQIIKDRKVHWIGTEYHILPDEWDSKSDKIVIPLLSSQRYALLCQIKANSDWELRRLYALADKGLSAEQLIKEFLVQKTCATSVFEFMHRRAIHLAQIGKIRGSKACTQGLSRFMRFRNDVDLPFSQIDSAMMQCFEAQLKDEGLTKNTISFYMRQLRVCYNLAVEEEITVDRRPFKRVYTGVDKTVKRAISHSDVERIAKLDLSGQPVMDFARDMFMFSFLTRGMSFIDMAYLRKSDLQNGVLAYCRKKTGQRLEIGWEKPMQRIVDKYGIGNTTQYLLPIITKEDGTESTQCINKLQQINRHLGKIGRLLNLRIKLTTYVARHSWASAARDLQIPLQVISEGLGHEDIKTTQIYLADIKTATIDKANRQIIRGL